MTLPIRIKKRPAALNELLLYAAGSFLTTLGTICGRAPFAIAFLSVCRTQNRLLASLCGSVVGAIMVMDFSSGLRHCAIEILIYSLFAAFRDTKYIEKEAFRPLGITGMCAAVEFAYLLRQGLSLPSFLAYFTYLLLFLSVSHYFSLLLLRQKSTGKDSAAAAMRMRLELSAAAFKDLYNSFGKASPSHNEENPAVVFDRAAETTCRSCKQRALCWNRAYIDTFNALNDATPAMLRRGKSVPEDYPQHFQERCIHLPEFLSAVNQELSALFLRRQYNRRLEAERQRARGQYAQLSEFLGQAAVQLDVIPTGKFSGSCPVGGAWRPKESEKICGDVISHFEIPGSKQCLLLSDGMGSGQEANREAANTARLLEQFLKAGVDAETALKTMNAALHLKGEDTGSFTTIDLLLVDPQKREATLYKYGAAPTYVKRHGSVRRLTGTALPAGLQDTHTPPVPLRIPLEEDMFILLVSDGLVDATADDWLQNLLAGWQGRDPQRLVSVLMAESKEHVGLRDDCSCICLSFSVRAKEV